MFKDPHTKKLNAFHKYKELKVQTGEFLSDKNELLAMKNMMLR